MQDGTRDGEQIRHWMHDRFVEKLIETKRSFVIVRGSKEERLARAIEQIDMLLQKHP